MKVKLTTRAGGNPWKVGDHAADWTDGIQCTFTLVIDQVLDTEDKGRVEYTNVICRLEVSYL